RIIEDQPIMDICGLSIDLIKQLTDFDLEEIDFMNNTPTMFEHIREMFNKIVAYHGEESPECIRYWAHQLGVNHDRGLMALREKNIFELIDVMNRTRTMGCSEWVRHNAELIEMYSEQRSEAFRKLTHSIGRILYLSEAQIPPSSSSSICSSRVSSTQPSIDHSELATPHTSETLTGPCESPCTLPVASPLTKSHFETALNAPMTLTITPELCQYEVPMIGTFPHYGESHCSSPIDVGDIPLPSEPSKF
ncbi:hypothetical protein PRIPAC_97047, partial [Pristionchus pacificus]|uniref:Uncharacterized protein n=1 Tax=Pristionchus pacificus TaxID=54126 RepID=A0A2A6BJR8_PRIPA